MLKQITDWLSVKKVFWIRLNTGAFAIEGKNRRFFKSHSLGAGCADLLAIKQIGTDDCFIPIWIEVKGSPEGRGSPYRQTHAQKFFEQMVVALGHRYVVAYSIDDLRGVI